MGFPVDASFRITKHGYKTKRGMGQTSHTLNTASMLDTVPLKPVIVWLFPKFWKMFERNGQEKSLE